MSTTNFTDKSTVIEADWLNEVDAIVHDIFDAASTKAAARTALNVENGATADQTGAEIKTLYEAESNTNAFTDTEKTKLSNIEANADVTDSGNVTPLVTGKQTIWIPAAAMTPTVSNGSASLAEVETTAGRPDMQVLDFDNAADEHAQFQIAFPKGWNEGTVTFQAFWTTTNTGTAGVAWGLQGVAVSDNGTIDVAYGTAVVVTDANQSAAEDLLVTTESGNITIAGTPAEGDLCFFRVFRDVSDGSDNMTEDARLLGIKLFFTTNAPTDD